MEMIQGNSNVCCVKVHVIRNQLIFRKIVERIYLLFQQAQERERERELRRNLSNSVASFLLSTLHVNVNHFFGNFSKKNSHNLLLLFILLLLFVRFKHYAIICRILNYSQHTLNTQHPFPFLLLLFTINLHLIILLFLTYL